MMVSWHLLSLSKRRQSAIILSMVVLLVENRTTINPPPRRVGSQPPQTEAVSVARHTVRLDLGQLRLIPHGRQAPHPEDLRAGIDGPHWFVTPGNPARFEAARQAAADARSRPRRTLPASV
jgi:hypothetical protein